MLEDLLLLWYNNVDIFGPLFWLCPAGCLSTSQTIYCHFPVVETLLLLSFIPSVDNMSEVSSLHDSLEPRGRGGRSQPPNLTTVYDRDEAMSTISSVSQQGRHHDDYPRRGGGYMGDRVRARSMDNLDDIGRRYGRDDYPPHRRLDEPRGRRG